MNYRISPMTIVRQVGNRFFLINAKVDYSKVVIPELSPLAVEIIGFLGKTRTEEELVGHFCSQEIAKEELLAYLAYLRNNGYIVQWEKSFDAKYISDLVKTEWSHSRTFYAVTLELSPKCNFHCIHCYLGRHRFDGEQELSTVQIKQIIDLLAEEGLFSVFLSGGEPLLRKDFVEIYKYVRKKGMLVDVFTNGYLINDKIVEAFETFPPMEIDISLYGASDEKYYEITRVKGAFTRIEKNIDLLLSKGITVSLKAPIIAPLKDEIEPMKNFAKSKGLPFRMSFDVVPDIDNNDIPLRIPPEEIPQLKKRYSEMYAVDKSIVKECLTAHIVPNRKKYNCSTGKCSGFIDYKGNFSPCIELRFKGKNIFENDFKKMWRECKAYEEIDEKGYACVNCTYMPVCSSCPAIRERMNGSPKNIVPSDCEAAKLYYNFIKEDIENEQVDL